ncbi:hypothetical protein E2C01_032511 [Portunus trituberculatus]|uniref:Uncharacterized protein n=1 Tax=Portunus trituberculatus TaxID=210409 RepID=A0A5B7EXP8_PORTR|nr:hypothetical protein [Portunus trituberculatus]
MHLGGDMGPNMGTTINKIAGATNGRKLNSTSYVYSSIFFTSGFPSLSGWCLLAKDSWHYGIVSSNGCSSYLQNKAMTQTCAPEDPLALKVALYHGNLREGVDSISEALKRTEERNIISNTKPTSI